MKKSLAIIALLAWPLYLNDFYLIVLDDTRLGLLWTLDIVFFLLIPSATLGWLIRSGRISLREIGLAAPPRPGSILAGLGLCAVLVVLIEWNLGPWIKSLWPWGLFSGYDFPARQPLRGCFIVYAALSAGVLEEIVYRGVVISQLTARGKSAAFAVAASCILFAGIHWSEGPAKLIYTAAWSAPLAAWFVRRRSLWGPITCHTAYNLLAFTGVINSELPGRLVIFSSP